MPKHKLTEAEEIYKIIDCSTVKQYHFYLIEQTKTRWEVKGSIPHVAIMDLDRANYTCYLSDNIFYISSLGRKS